jgi:hypothetical protein
MYRFMYKSFSSLVGSLSATATIVTAAALLGCSASPQSAIQTKADGAIIGGQDATGSEDFATSIAALYDVKEGGLCTATILSDTILLTASHCVESEVSNLVVLFGTSVEAAGKARRIRPVAGYIKSPLWEKNQNNQTNTGDIALVRFEGGLPPGFKAATVLGDANELKDGGTVLLAGYGISDGVEQTGSGTLRSVETIIKSASFSESEVLVDQTNGKGACHGDSGGPAFIRKDGKLLVFGVTSRGVQDAMNNCSKFSAYTSATHYSQWIVETTQRLMKGERDPAPKPNPDPIPFPIPDGSPTPKPTAATPAPTTTPAPKSTATPFPRPTPRPAATPSPRFPTPKPVATPRRFSTPFR